jgi:hypothetical protein
LRPPAVFLFHSRRLLFDRGNEMRFRLCQPAPQAARRPAR